jgi:hypothetical protein
MRQPVVLSMGLGTNSVAMVIDLVNRGEPIDLILFADTGGEHPKTYAYRDLLDTWLMKQGRKPIETVCLAGPTLEDDCLKKKTMPSVAFGFKTCSQRWKIEPQEKRLNGFPPARSAWKAGLKVVKLIGFDADEPQRAKPFEDEKFVNRYPLIERGLDRDDCKEIIRKAGLPLPGKSSCFFCPNMKSSEIEFLRDNEPETYARALAMQANAELGAGLGRVKPWKQIGDQMGFDMPCGCIL